MNSPESLKPLRDVPVMRVEVMDGSRRVGASTRVLMEVAYQHCKPPQVHYYPPLETAKLFIDL